MEDDLSILAWLPMKASRESSKHEVTPPQEERLERLSSIQL